MFKIIIKRIGLAIGGIVIAILIAFIFGIAVMYLWNWLMPEIFGLPEISFWQAWGFVILSKILFGRLGHPQGDSHFGRFRPPFRDSYRDPYRDPFNDDGHRCFYDKFRSWRDKRKNENEEKNNIKAPNNEHSEKDDDCTREYKM